MHARILILLSAFVLFASSLCGATDDVSSRIAALQYDQITLKNGVDYQLKEQNVKLANELADVRADMERNRKEQESVKSLATTFFVLALLAIIVGTVVAVLAPVLILKRKNSTLLQQQQEAERNLQVARELLEQMRADFKAIQTKMRNYRNEFEAKLAQQRLMELDAKQKAFGAKIDTHAMLGPVTPVYDTENGAAAETSLPAAQARPVEPVPAAPVAVAPAPAAPVKIPAAKPVVAEVPQPVSPAPAAPIPEPVVKAAPVVAEPTPIAIVPEPVLAPVSAPLAAPEMKLPELLMPVSTKIAAPQSPVVAPEIKSIEAPLIPALAEIAVTTLPIEAVVSPAMPIVPSATAPLVLPIIAQFAEPAVAAAAPAVKPEAPALEPAPVTVPDVPVASPAWDVEIERCRALTEATPQLASVWRELGDALVAAFKQSGDATQADEALRHYQAAQTRDPADASHAVAAGSLLTLLARQVSPAERVTRLAEAEKQLMAAELIKRGAAAYELATLCAMASRPEDARKWLVMARLAGSPKAENLNLLRADPDLDPLRELTWFRSYLNMLESDLVDA